jgi:bidirectional [NiFe] hydrogenase diaphorase subunit
LSRAYGVATFYHFFTLKPAGEHTCVICMGTACYIKGAPQLLDAVQRDLGIVPGKPPRTRKSRCSRRAVWDRAAWLRQWSTIRKSRARLATAGHPRAPEEMDARMTPEELEQIAESERAAQSQFTQRVNVCVAAGCLSCQSQSVKDALDQEVARRGTKDHCQVKGVGCMGLCSEGPLVSTSVALRGSGVGSALQESRSRGWGGHSRQPGGRAGGAAGVSHQRSVFSAAEKIVLENSGVIDPERIEDYVAANGYSALIKALTEMTSREVIDQVTKSGLRGRGGAGYPTGLKWSTVSKSVGTQKYVICNADEGDPGAFMDRSVLESDPHRVLEGMLIAAYAVGASEGYIYVRAEYPLAIKRLRNAIRQAERVGLLGSNICGTRFSFRVDVRSGCRSFRLRRRDGADCLG